MLKPISIKILLINPGFYYFPGFLENVVNYKKTPLGLAYLAAYVRAKHPVDIRICDAYAMNMSESEVVRYAETFCPDIIGISVTTPTAKFAKNVSLRLKKEHPEILTIFGGPHVSALPFENLDACDVCVIGEGEETFAELVQNHAAGCGFEQTAGIVFRKNNHIVKTGERRLIENLDSIPFPARDLLPKIFFPHIYPYPHDSTRTTTIITSRGCNFNCNFCANEVTWGNRVRFRSLNNIFAEIEHLVKHYGCEFLHIHDDNFTSDPQRVIEFSRRKHEYFPKLKWFCHSRADALNREILKEMKAGECVEVQIGVESGSDHILDACNKKMKTETVSAAFRLLKENKINQWATFIIGNYGETKKTIRETIRFSMKLDPTYASFLFLTPLPGTKSYEYYSRGGFIKTLDWDKYNWHLDPVFETDSLSKSLLLTLRTEAYIKFYLRWRKLQQYMYAFIISKQWKRMFLSLILILKFIFGINKRTASR